MELIQTIRNLLLEEVAAIPVGTLAVSILVACIVGLLILLVYKLTYGGALFDRRFALGLVLMSMITCAIILAISSNLVLSLGMVGALSIVRFRTAIKEPMDTIFMFWSLAAGILSGAGFMLISLLATLIIGCLFILLFALSGRIKASDSYLLVLRYRPEAAASVREALSRLPQGRLRSESVLDAYCELVYELRLSDKQAARISQLRTTEGIEELSLVGYPHGGLA